MNIENELKKLNLKRYKSGIGKKVGNDLYFHHSYIENFLSEQTVDQIIRESEKQGSVLKNFNFAIIRYNKKENNISFIECENFDKSDEPIVGDSIKFDLNTKKITKTKQPSNPLIYHHKWMFVDDNYTGFNVEESKKRSLQWKSILGVNKEISSKIGRLNFWKEWLKKNNIETMQNETTNIKKQLETIKSKKEIPECWSQYYEPDKINQTISSASTSRSQLPRTAKFIQNFNLQNKGNTLLDIGCGHKNEKFIEFLNNLGFDYYGCDLFNQPANVNHKAIEHCKNGNADVITINNVFNTIKENEIIINLLEQAKNALNNEHGILNILTYEGKKNKNDKKLEEEAGKKLPLQPIETRDGYQRRQKTEEYMNLVSQVFPNSQIVNSNGTKVIVAANNPDINLSNEFPKKTRKNKIKN